MVGVLVLTLLMPQAGEADSGAQLPRFRLLAPSDAERVMQTRCGSCLMSCFKPHCHLEMMENDVTIQSCAASPDMVVT